MNQYENKTSNSINFHNFWFNRTIVDKDDNTLRGKTQTIPVPSKQHQHCELLDVIFFTYTIPFSCYDRKTDKRLQFLKMQSVLLKIQ